MTAVLLNPVAPVQPEMSDVTVDSETLTDPFNIDLTIVTEVDADLLPRACDTGDGCKPSCASSCASAV